MRTLFAAAAAACLFAVAPALAQDAAVVAAPAGHAGVVFAWGDLVSSLAQLLAALAAGAVAFALRSLPAGVGALVSMFRVDQLLGRAIQSGINSVAGAQRGKTLEFSTGLQVLDRATQYALDNGPAWLIAWAGGPQGIAQKVWARMDLAGDARAPDFGALAAKTAAR